MYMYNHVTASMKLNINLVVWYSTSVHWIQVHVPLTTASGIIILSKKSLKYRKLDQNEN